MHLLIDFILVDIVFRGWLIAVFLFILGVILSCVMLFGFFLRLVLVSCNVCSFCECCHITQLACSI